MNGNLVPYQPKVERIENIRFEQGLDEQVQNFERRLDDLGRTYQQAVWWAANYPHEWQMHTQETVTHAPKPSWRRRMVRNCGAALVAVGNQLIERSGLEQENAGIVQEDFFSTVPSLNLVQTQKE